LAAELRRLRETASGRTLTLAEVATALGWSPSKISRYELAQSGLKPDEVEKMLDFYGITDPQRAQLLTLARDAVQKGWWEDYGDAITDEYMTFIGLEAEATSISQWQVEVVPGLLQTEDYARQVHLGYQRVMPTSPGIIERRVEIRMRRQQVLTSEHPVKLSVVLDESVLQRRIGERLVMHAQLMRLAEAAELPNVTLRVLRLSSEHSLVGDSFVIFNFDTDRSTTMLHDVVSTEFLKDEFHVEGEALSYEQRLAFERLELESASPVESREIIVQTAQRFWA
jgi:transcriptional regulator with XRE-family HTH domain